MTLTKKAERTKEKLLASAQKLINERGYDRVSVEDITKDSGVAKGTFYHYFKTKDEIVSEIVERSGYDRYQSVLTMDAPVEERLYQYFLNFFEGADFVGIRLSREWMRKVLTPKGKKEWSEQFSMLYQSVRGILVQGIKKGELKESMPVDVVVRIILSHFCGAFTIWCITDGGWKMSGAGRAMLRKDFDRLFDPYKKKKSA